MTKHPTIPMSPLSKPSSQIEAIGHDGDTLAVKFKSGGAVYHYHGVTPDKFAEMQKSDSVGKFLHAHIKPHHKFTKLDV